MVRPSIGVGARGCLPCCRCLLWFRRAASLNSEATLQDVEIRFTEAMLNGGASFAEIARKEPWVTRSGDRLGGHVRSGSKFRAHLRS